MDFMTEFNLSKKDSRRLTTIINKIDKYQRLETKMDFVDCLDLSSELDITDEQCDEIDDYLRNVVVG